MRASFLCKFLIARTWREICATEAAQGVERRLGDGASPCEMPAVLPETIAA